MESKPSPYNTPPPVYSEAIASAPLPTPTGAPPPIGAGVQPLNTQAPPIGAGVAPTQPTPYSPPVIMQPQQQQFVVQGAQFAQVQQGQTAGGQPIYIIQGPPPPRPANVRVVRAVRGNNHRCMTPQQLAAARRKKMIVSIVIIVVCIIIIVVVSTTA